MYCEILTKAEVLEKVPELIVSSFEGEMAKYLLKFQCLLHCHLSPTEKMPEKQEFKLFKQT